MNFNKLLRIEHNKRLNPNTTPTFSTSFDLHNKDCVPVSVVVEHVKNDQLAYSQLFPTQNKQDTTPYPTKTEPFPNLYTDHKAPLPTVDHRVELVTGPLEQC